MFTVRSCHRRLHGEVGCPDRGFWGKLWRLNLPGKVINLLWRVCANVLPTAATLANKHVDISVVCGWCRVSTEDAVHVLFYCCYARNIWESVSLRHYLNLQPNDGAMDIFHRFFSVANQQQCVLFGLMCWGL